MIFELNNSHYFIVSIFLAYTTRKKGRYRDESRPFLNIEDCETMGTSKGMHITSQMKVS